MRSTLFPRLAIMGISKNRKFYMPYLLSSIGMVMMFYILQALSTSPFVTEMYHGEDIGFILSLGKFVIAAFSLLFLFYINSFLVKRRYKEFGLYNILGMNKRNIAAIVTWESFFTSFTSILCGIGLGIAFSKLAELGLLNMTKSDINYDLTVSTEAIGYTVLLYGIIFLILTAKSLIVVSRAKPLELMQSVNYGEKPVKANWVLALLGVGILGGAYYMAVTIDNPLSAITMFFVAALMVIVATYLLFISGSVALCKLLQRNKKYYYKKNHFISVSSMVYRMNRNGAGLASIAILSTMVLVMVSTTGSLYFGTEDALRTRYPRDTEISVILNSIDEMSDEKINEIRAGYQAVFDRHRFIPEDALDYRFATVTGLYTENGIDITPQYDLLAMDYNRIRQLFFVSLDDYNRIMNTSYTLSNGEAMLCSLHCQYDGEELCIGDVRLHINRKLDSFFEIGGSNALIVPSFMLVIPDYDVLRPLDETIINEERALEVRYHYAYNSGLSDEETVQLYEEQIQSLKKTVADDSGYSFFSGCLPAERDDFYSTFGGLFFLGIILSIIFIFAAAVIIYYKQVSEGYEDQKRFEIMQNMGMTKKDIKSNINSQILTVFFAPLLVAGIHLGFAFPFLWKIMQMFNLMNLPFVIIITLIGFMVFGCIYALIYKATARAYYGIVSKTS